MSKRYVFPQQNGERKKARLDITISDHNFPLSQNGNNNEAEQDNWGDDNDDEILLLASQACEEAYNDISSLPDYSLCMKPGSTSTQLSDPEPSTSTTGFTFKKPSAIPSNVVSTSLKDKCNRISSPLPGMSSKILPKNKEYIDLNEIFNEKIYKGQNTDHVYKQLLKLQEENANLKSENGKLLEKCVTKEGEASILRTQLKSCQVAVDNARMERIKAQEKVQMEWTEKLTAANGQMHDLRTQLDFKNLEIISVKEKCRMLESNKVKLTQVTVSNDVNSSHRNNSLSTDFVSSKRAKMTSNGVQTDDKAHFIKLNQSYRSEQSKLTLILPIILEATKEQHSLLEYNEKLQNNMDLSQNKCRIYSTFHRIPTTPAVKEAAGNKVTINCLYEDLMKIGAGRGDDMKCLDNILSSIKLVLSEVLSQLDQISQKMTTAFQKEMDEKYIDNSDTFLVVEEKELLSGRPLFKEEQAILGRRMTSILSNVLQACRKELFDNYHEECSRLLTVVSKICQLLDTTSCALLYSGFILSIIHFMNTFVDETRNINIIDTLKSIISSRPMTFISCEVLKLVGKLSLDIKFIYQLCPRNNTANLKLDYDQGVLLYKKDSCYLQILLKQVETALKSIEKQKLTEQAVNTASHLVSLYSNTNDWTSIDNQDRMSGCDCQLILIQIIVYALRICAVMLKDKKKSNNDQSQLLIVCRSGIQVLYQCSLRDVELSSQLQHNEGHLLEFCDLMRGLEQPPVYANMLSELTSTFLSLPEDVSPENTSPVNVACSPHHQPWLSSFKNFSLSE